MLTEPSEFVQVSCTRTGRWHYMVCLKFDSEDTNQYGAQLQNLKKTKTKKGHSLPPNILQTSVWRSVFKEYW